MQTKARFKLNRKVRKHAKSYDHLCMSNKVNTVFDLWIFFTCAGFENIETNCIPRENNSMLTSCYLTGDINHYTKAQLVSKFYKCISCYPWGVKIIFKKQKRG